MSHCVAQQLACMSAPMAQRCVSSRALLIAAHSRRRALLIAVQACMCSSAGAPRDAPEPLGDTTNNHTSPASCSPYRQLEA